MKHKMAVKNSAIDQVHIEFLLENLFPKVVDSLLFFPHLRQV